MTFYVVRRSERTPHDAPLVKRLPIFAPRMFVPVIVHQPVHSVVRIVVSLAGVYPDNTGNGTFMLKHSDGPVNITLDYSTVKFFASPEGELDWAVWSVFSVPEEIASDYNFGWGSRVDTVGGKVPGSCSAADNRTGLLGIPYSAMYYFYSCDGSSSSSKTSDARSLLSTPSMLVTTTLMTVAIGTVTMSIPSA